MVGGGQPCAGNDGQGRVDPSGLGKAVSVAKQPYVVPFFILGLCTGQ